VRIDQFLVSIGLAPSRTKAQELIQHGDVEVRINNQWQTAHQTSFKADSLKKEDVRLTADSLLQFVSRGGRKLQGVLDQIGMDVTGVSALDIGISTGGFADCLLQRGAQKIVGIDVGSGQLAEKLKKDERVISFEKINARDLSTYPELTPHLQGVSLCVIDVSFISLTLVLPEVPKVLGPHHLLALIKPQFELSAQALSKAGVVQNPTEQDLAKARVRQAAESAGYQIFSIMPAALRGSDGNQEFFLYAQHGVE
jgi:23S rRNA (cytidine1920-2'-O)/16S rRNA (cytidine1409-2'-O)-methyltransferase